MTDFASVPFLAGADYLIDQEKQSGHRPGGLPRCHFCGHWVGDYPSPEVRLFGQSLSFPDGSLGVACAICLDHADLPERYSPDELATIYDQSEDGNG